MENDTKNSIVYKHTFPNGKVYIGITKMSPKQRWGNQGKGYYHNKEMWEAIKKYGWNNIHHEILYENMTTEEADRLEKELIKKYDSLNPQKGYNKTAGGFSNYSTYDEDKIIELWKCGKNITELRAIFGCCRHTLHTILKRNGITKVEMMTRALGVAVKQYDLQGNYLKTFSSLSEAGRSISVNNSTHILECCNKERYSYYGYIWRYENDNEEVKPLEFSIHTRQINQYSLSGEFIRTFDSLKDAARFAHINSNNISRVCRGERHSAGGYKW